MARQTNTAITYDDANYMVTNEGFSRIGNIISGKKAMTKANIDAYLNTDDSLYSSYASNRLVPYQLLQPVAVCCPPIMTQIVEDGLYLDLYWTFDSNCSSVSAVAVTESSDGVNWSSWTTSDPAAPRRVINRNVTTYYKSRSWCGGVQSGDSNIVVYNPPAAPQEPLNIYTVAISEYQASTAIESDAATSVDQSVQIEVSLTAISGTGASVQLGGAIYAPLTTVGQTATVFATVKPSETYFISYTLNGEGATATVKSRVISASIDAIPSPDFVSYSLEVPIPLVGFEILNQSGYITTATFTDHSTSASDIAFSDDGMHLAILSVYQEIWFYSLGTAYNYSTATLKSYGKLPGSDLDTFGICIAPGGLSVFIALQGLGTVSLVSEYTLSSAYNSTAMVYKNSVDIAPNGQWVTGLDISPDGKTLIVIESESDSIYEYRMAGAWDLTTAAHTGTLQTSLAYPRSVRFVDGGNSIVAVDQIPSIKSRPYQWDLSTPYRLGIPTNYRAGIQFPEGNNYYGIFHQPYTDQLIWMGIDRAYTFAYPE